MAKYKLNIVALPYHDLKGCLGEFYAEVMGQSVTMMQDISNEVDDKAVIVYDWLGRHIGFVSRGGRLMALEMMAHEGKNSLRATVTGIDTEHNCLTVEVNSDWGGKVYDLHLNNDYESWHYTGPRMKPTKDMLTLNYMMDEIGYRLSDEGSLDEVSFRGLLERFCKTTKLDISAEMADYRKQLKAKLEKRGLDEFAKMVELENGHAGRESTEGEVKDYWLGLLKSQGKGSRLYAEREKYSVDEIERQLMEFPDNLYNLWVNSRDQFVAKAYYMHIPRQVLWDFLSGIAFVEMIRRELAGSSVTFDEEKRRLIEVAKRTYQFDTPKMDILRNLFDKAGWYKESDELTEWMKENTNPLVSIGSAQDVIANGGTKNVNKIVGE